MIRRLLLASVSVAAISASVPVNAQILDGLFGGGGADNTFLLPGTDTPLTGPGAIVFDPSSVFQLIQSLQQALKLYTLTQTIEGDVAHLTNANTLATALNELKNSMPHTSVMPTAITGNSAFGSAADGWAAQFHDQNVVYDPTEGGADDWVAKRMAIDAQWLANSQGASAANLDNLESRADALTDLQNCVDNSDTLQDESACNSRLAAENTYQQNQAAQATNLLILTNGQRDAAAQAQQQYTREVLDTANTDLCNALNGFGSPNVSTLCMHGGGGAPGAAVVANNGG